MSTRSNTVIKDMETGIEAYLYRHFDGYISGAGVEQVGYVNLMQKEMQHPTIEAVEDWYIKNGDGYEETSGIHGDVEYIYVLELNGPKSKFNLRAFETKMFATNGGKSAVKDKEVTDKLAEEVDRAMKAGELDDVKGFRPQDCPEFKAQQGQEPGDGELWDKVATAVDDIWDGELREKLIDAVVGRLKG